jgi:hypothetical protein
MYIWAVTRGVRIQPTVSILLCVQARPIQHGNPSLRFYRVSGTTKVENEQRVERGTPAYGHNYTEPRFYLGNRER